MFLGIWSARNNLHRVRWIALLPKRTQGRIQNMKRRIVTRKRKICLAFGLLLLVDATRNLIGEPTAAAVSVFNAYTEAVESRLVRQHNSQSGFLASFSAEPKDAEERLRRGEAIIQRVTEPGSASANAGLGGAILHHWRGTAFARGATAADFERLVRDFDSYPQHFAPQVIQARTCAEHGDQGQAWMRIRQKHVITVVMDTTYDVTFGRLDMRHGYSISRSIRIDEIADPGTRAEHALSAAEEHGFLWRLNTYWSYEERDGGLYLQIEAVSLTRSIPSGLGWLIGPFIESIPRESLEFTLNSARQALHK
jgi:hypothetical protein